MNTNIAPKVSPEELQELCKDHPGAIGFVHVHLNAETSETIRYNAFVASLFKQMSREMMKAHCAMGVCGEAGELADAIKREIIYGKPVDRTNIVEELGDLRFYMQATMMLYGIPEQEVLQANAYKLSERYKGLVYSDQAAIDRADKNAKPEN